MAAARGTFLLFTPNPLERMVLMGEESQEEGRGELRSHFGHRGQLHLCSSGLMALLINVSFAEINLCFCHLPLKEY